MLYDIKKSFKDWNWYTSGQLIYPVSMMKINVKIEVFEIQQDSSSSK